MAAKNTAGKARQAAEGAWNSPYAQRLAQDPELRENLRAAFESARSAYGRLTNGKPVAKVVSNDKKFQKDLKQASQSLKDAGDALREGPKKKRRFGLGKLLLLAILGGGIALVVSEPLRNKVLDALFGAEEEFDYQSTTTAPPPPPPASDASPAAAESSSG
jgi:hypothetical protein